MGQTQEQLGSLAREQAGVVALSSCREGTIGRRGRVGTRLAGGLGQEVMAEEEWPPIWEFQRT